MKIASRIPLRRLVVLDQMVRNGDYPNASTAAVALEVHARTIARDLEFLRDSWGAPLEFSYEHNGYYYRDADYTLPLQRLSESELIALFLAERVMQQYADTPYAKDLATAFRKLTMALPDEVTINLNHLDKAFSFRQPAERLADLQCFRSLTRAVREHRRLELVYWTASRDETCRRVVDPYHLTSIDGDWYLIAYCHLREEVRMFVPARIKQLQVWDEGFEPPADFHVDDFLDGSFRVMRGDGKPRQIRLRFKPSAARYVAEKVWHPSQQIQKKKDGSLILTLALDHFLEVKRWVLAYGPECEVLEPAELREEVRQKLRKAASQYGS